MEGQMMKKYANYGGLAGLALVLIGLFLYSVNSVVSTFTAIVLIFGTALLIANVVLKFSEIKTGLSSRSAKFGSNAALMILFIFGIIVVVNIVLNRFTWRVDTTAAKQFSLADQTKKVLSSLDQDVKVTGFFKTNEEFRAKELLTEYSQVSPKFSFEFVDPDKKPGIAKKYDIKAYSTLVVEGESKTEKITESTEQALTNALIKVTREGVKKIYFTQNHQEKDYDVAEAAGLSKAKTAIEEQNFQLEKISLISGQHDSIPNDCSVLVIAGPMTSLLPPEEQMVESYLKRGGKVIFMLDPESPPQYGFFLAKYGIKVGNDLVVDASPIGQFFGAGPIIPLVSQYEAHAITEGFGMMTFYPQTRSVAKMEEVPTGLTVTEVAKTSAQSWGEVDPITDGEVGFDETRDIEGPVAIFTVAEKTADNPNQVEDKYGVGTSDVKTRLAVIGDSDFATNAHFQNQGNGNLFMNTINWLAEEEDLISVRPKDPEDRRLSLTQKQSRTILYLGVLMLPLLIFVTGIFVYTKRK
jgi:ABC-type uncharacterized transport system involved in gliding motility auxiliary subunit